MDDKRITELIYSLIDYINELIKKKYTENDSQYVADNIKALAMLLIAKALNDKKI